MTDTQYRKDPDVISGLTPEQFAVTQQSATEPAYAGSAAGPQWRASAPAGGCPPAPRSSHAAWRPPLDRRGPSSPRSGRPAPRHCRS